MPQKPSQTASRNLKKKFKDNFIMDKVIILRYSEIHLKGKNRMFFENILRRNILEKLEKFELKTQFSYGRYVISEYDPEQENRIVSALKTVFGLFSLSIATKTTADPADIAEAAVKLCSETKGTFRVTVNRADKTLPYTSVELAKKTGGAILNEYPDLTVDLHDPDFTVYIDVREKNTSFVYSQSIPCAGGMPIGSAGKGLTLLSGGIDSPVSTYMMAKRGLKLTALHFWSYPYTSLEARDKVLELAKLLSVYTGTTEVIVVPFTKIQEAIHKHAESNYMITLVRRSMMRIAEKIAEKKGCGCIINGEDLGQVASQTLESITVTNSVIRKLPVFRPLIGYDKIDIIDIAQKIGTYETSIKPFEDCCTVFLPDSPVTKPTLRRCELNESKIVNYDELIDEAVDNAEVFVVAEE